MYLVHKCSIEFFRWASANSDKLADIIKEAKQMKSDLEKMDANVAQMYATKCQKSQEDLLALMKKGGWLTAQEAKEWGFVDEITDYEEDAAPVITDSIAADMGAAGIPVPSHLAKEQPSTLLTRFIEALTNIFKSNSNAQSDMNPNNEQQQEQQKAQQQQQTPETTAQQHEQQELQEQPTAEAMAQKDQEIATLKAEIEALKKAPGASTSHVVENDKSDKEEDNDPSSPEAFFNTRKRAQALYDMMP
jgi:enoyl-CoA hydratase/carnithine racemase